jgi:hypothetical protein
MIFQANTTSTRGHHSTLTAVDLPFWLPPNALQEMVNKYRVHVKKEVIRELHPEVSEQGGHRRSGKVESESAASVGSQASGHNVLKITD